MVGKERQCMSIIIESAGWRNSVLPKDTQAEDLTRDLRIRSPVRYPFRHLRNTPNNQFLIMTGRRCRGTADTMNCYMRSKSKNSWCMGIFCNTCSENYCPSLVGTFLLLPSLSSQPWSTALNDVSDYLLTFVFNASKSRSAFWLS